MDIEDDTPKVPKRPIPYKKIAKITLIVVASLIVLLIIWLVVDQFISQSRIAAAAKDAPAKITKARDTAIIAGDKKMAQFQNTMKDLGIAGDSIGYSKTNVCYFYEQSDAIFSSSFWQACFIRYVQGYSTPLLRSDVASKLSGQPADVGMDGTFALANCSLSDNAYEGGRSSISYRPQGVSAKNDDCAVPDPASGIGSFHITRYDNKPVLKAYSVFDPAKIDNTTNQVWFSADIDYYSEVLGCKPWLLTCVNPRTTPILGS